ncbi:MAG: zinc ABC transporter substrate-binding protein [Planctomycetia bacterium]|nr:zinc ABC transporter substrate-binding protein [Planctomycetia bacterium]
MKINISIFLSTGLILLLSIFGCTPAEHPKSEKLQVYTSFYPIYDFVSKIAQEKADIYNLIPPGTEVHHWEPSPTEMMRLETADVLFYNGLGMEPWLEKIRASLKNKNLKFICLSTDVKLQEGGCSHEHHGAHCHHRHDKNSDPHIWLRPLNAKKMLENIKNAFCQMDKDNDTFYTANYEKWANECMLLDTEFRNRLTPLPQKDIIVSHQAFGYLCHEYGLTQIAVEGLSPASEPTPSRMAEILQMAKKHKVRVIFFEDQANPKVAQELAKTLGATTDVLNPYEDLTEEQIAAGEDYFSIMRKNLLALENALKP